MSKALQFNSISKVEYLNQKCIPNSAPMTKPLNEEVKRSQVSAPVFPPGDVQASQGTKKTLPQVSSPKD